MASVQVQAPQAQVCAKLTNKTASIMLCDRYISLDGTPAPGTLPSIVAGGVLSLDGVVAKGFVQYSGINTQNLPCAWILAWDALPPTGSRRRVYVISGARNVISQMTQAQILQSLNRGLESGIYIDKGTKTSVYGTVTAIPGVDKVNVTADFGELKDITRYYG